MQSLVVDTHADVLLQVNRGADISKRLDFGHIDLIRLKEGGVDVQVFAVWPNPESKDKMGMYDQSLYMLNLFDNIIKRNPDKVIHVRTPEDIDNTVKDKKIAALIGVEGGTAIENDLSKIKILYDRGMRYLGLTWNDSPGWASSAKDETDPEFRGHRGLTEFGRAVIKELNRLGVIVDVSHSGEQTFWDAIELSSKPIIASHSCCYALCKHYRNLKDEQIKAIKKNGGVIFINFYPGYLQNGFDSRYAQLRKSKKSYMDSTRKAFGDKYLDYRKYRAQYYATQTESFRPGIKRLVDHMDHIISLIGDDHVGLGSDFDGISVLPKGMKNVSDMPELTRVMMERGYSEERIRKILGGNFMRVFREVSMSSTNSE
jgi:membrane dipeptidase